MKNHFHRISVRKKIFTLLRALKQAGQKFQELQKQVTELQRNKSVYRIHTIKHQALCLTTTNRIREKAQNTQCNTCEHVEMKSWFRDCSVQYNYRLLPKGCILQKGCGQLHHNWPFFPFYTL